MPKWNASIDKHTLSFQFNAPEVLFDIGQSNVNIKFQNILNGFIPRYLEVLSNYKISIDEIRIEGHISFEWRYKIRVEQGLIKDNISSWEEVYKYSDTALYGIINMLERNQASIPDYINI